jgi:hypothetical protein
VKQYRFPSNFGIVVDLLYLISSTLDLLSQKLKSTINLIITEINALESSSEI